MLWQILKKDMMKRKGVNIILFLFITLATVFLASSIHNISVVFSAVDYYMDYANVPEMSVVMNSDKDIQKINHWLDEQKAEENIDDYEFNHFIEISSQSISVHQDEKEKTLKQNGIGLYLSTMDVDYCQVFDTEGNPLILNDDEIGISISLMENEKLQVGDQLTIKSGGVEKTLTIKTATKDAAYGNEMVGMSRFMVNQKNFKAFQNNADQLGIYYISTSQGSDLSQELSNQGFEGVMNIISIDMYQLIYSFDMIIAGLLILVGVCLIFIALLVLRFTLVFSLEEQYQEIGILKAIGLRNNAIKKLYLIKYFAIVIVGATLGALLSIPVSQKMIDGVSQNMIMNSQEIHVFMNIMCALIIVVLVISFCYLCTRKLNKVSAITAIHGGYTGERFYKNRGIRLSRSQHISVPFYLGMNDIMTHITRYIVLMVTFSISFILITIPLNTLNTMKSTEMSRKFALNPESSVYVRKIEGQEDKKYHNTEELMEGVRQLQQNMEDKGYQADMTVLPIYFINYSNEESNKKNKIMSLQVLGESNSYLEYDEGVAPQLENEMAFSKDIMKENNWVIGDYVKATINGQDKTMLITGTYTDYMQIGKSARLNSKIDCGQEVLFDYWTVMVDLKTDQSQEEVVQIMQKDFPQYEWKTAQELIDQNVGGIQEILSSLLLPMTAMLCGVIMLITLLMEKLFMTREKGEIAMMKSIGFRHSSIRYWQIIRMALVVIVSMIISIPLSLVTNHILLRPIFAIMGAELTIQVNPLRAYLIYPGILLVGIIIATTLATRSAKNINIREMNNLE